MTNAKVFQTLLTKHAPVTLKDLTEAASYGVGHVEDAIADMRGDLDSYKDKPTLIIRGWSPEQAEEADSLRFVFDCVSEMWPNLDELCELLNERG